MVEITIQVPDELGKRLERVRERLPDVLERGLADVLTEESIISADEQEIIQTLATSPSPETILALRPSEALQARISELLARSKEGPITHVEESEMERYLTLEHWVRLAKAYAYQQLAKAP